MGQGTLLAKIDIKHAFRLLPAHPADRHFLAMHWKNQIFMDTSLSFGLRSAPTLFNTLANLLSWILQKQGITLLLHYLDDFLLMGPPPTVISVPQKFNNSQGGMCTTRYPFGLGGGGRAIRITNILGNHIRHPVHGSPPTSRQLKRITTQVSSWLTNKKATKREILSLVGLLQYATKVVKPGRTHLYHECTSLQPR